ncbi:hypothetical protein MACJ_001386 [Theileria orientalis]|uniref:Uncharacterized protein n=1 Tax=Theileria orientalis TaxID=68886 RepID=A0A976MAT1_THEOR|nr:hypothetical protein MACJ_001386 [Theileria orientalis]
MEHYNDEVYLKNRELAEQTTAESNTNDKDNDDTDDFPLGRLQEVEDKLSQIVSTGIQDTSFMRDAETCTQIWEHTNKLFPDPQNDDFGVDVRLKNVVRALGEGSVLPLTDLVTSLKICLIHFCDFGVNFDDKLSKLVPIFLTRRNLGESYVALSGLSRSECKRTECLWVWESPTLDVFPSHLHDKVKTFRENRNLISRRYKALSKLKNSILTENLAGQQAALEVLNTLDRKMLQDKERKEKLGAKRKLVDNKKKHEKVKVQKTANMLLTWLKPQKSEKNDEVEENESQTSTNTAEYTPENIFIEGSDDQKAELERILSSVANTNKLKDIYFVKKPNVMNQGVQPSNEGDPEASKEQDMQDDEREGDIFDLANLHRDVWTRFHSYMDTNRQFYVETAESSHMWVSEPLSNVEDATHNASELKAKKHCRVFSMFDSGWKRPPMRYVVGRTSVNVTSLNQLGQEANLDYWVDSDEDWFERYDADDVEVSEEEEEEEEDEDQDWIVQDTPNVHEFSTGVFFTSENDANGDASKGEGFKSGMKGDLSAWAKVFCLYRNWHWIVDGKPLDYELSNKELAVKNGMKLTRSEYGFGFEGYTKNPIVEMVRKLRGDKIRLSRRDVEALLKLCHGKHTRKEDLILAFKEERPMTSVSEIRSKFGKYLTREKIDDKPHRWMVTPEAAKLFNIRKELDRILTDQLNQEILSEPVF